MTDTDPEQAAPIALCPVCGAISVHHVRHRLGLVIIADHLCGNGHGWQIKWVQEAAA